MYLSAPSHRMVTIVLPATIDSAMPQNFSALPSISTMQVLHCSSSQPKPVHWVGSSHQDLLKCPEEVTREFGYALWLRLYVELGRQASSGAR